MDNPIDLRIRRTRPGSVIVEITRLRQGYGGQAFILPPHFAQSRTSSFSERRIRSAQVCSFRFLRCRRARPA